MNYWNESKENIYVAAHRGLCATYPENTMEAFKAALDAGVDQIELDVRVTRDNELVIIHDSTVDRTTNGTGKVCDKLLAELKTLDAGSHKGEQFKGAQIPTFIEFMELIKDHPTITIDIELKEYPTAGHEEIAYDVCDRVLKIVDDYGFTDRIVINTFNATLHEYIFKKYGKKYRQHVYYPLSHLGKPTINPYEYAFCACMFRDFYNDLNMASKEAFEKMASLGVEPWAGACVKDEAGVDAAIDAGAVLITCNNGDEILEILRKKGYHA